MKRTNYTLFDRPSAKDDIPLKILELIISSKLVERKRFIKFLNLILDACNT